MINCGECQKEISDQAESCPHCGIKRPKKPSGCFVVILAVIGFAVVSSVYRQATKEEPPAKTPFQQAQDAEQEKKIQRAVALLRTVKKAAREPESIEWTQIIANTSGTVVCVEYRGKNGFGGYSKEAAVLVGDEIKAEKSAWKHHCTGSDMDNMKHAAVAVR